MKNSINNNIILGFMYLVSVDPMDRSIILKEIEIEKGLMIFFFWRIDNVGLVANFN